MKILELAFTEERKHVLETQEKEYIKKIPCGAKYSTGLIY